MVIIAGQRPGDGAYGWGGWLADFLLVNLRRRNGLTGEAGATCTEYQRSFILL